MKHRVLSTKKLEPSLIEQARKNNIEIIEQEFISIKAIKDDRIHERVMKLSLSGIKHAAFTSSNAVFSLDKCMHVTDTFYVFEWGIFCLSGKTKEAVMTAACLKGNVLAEAANAYELAQNIIEHKVEELIFFCGNKRRDELPSILQEAGIKIHEMIVYETVETAAMVTDDFDAILFFSPSAVQSFFSVNQIKKTTVCFAIGQTTADCITDFTDNRIIISESPSQEMMLASVNFYFQNTDCYE